MIGCPAAYDAATARPTQPGAAGYADAGDEPASRRSRGCAGPAVMRDRAYGGPRADERRRAQFRSLA